MLKISKHIEIVSSTEAGLSSMGPTSREAIRNSLAKRYSSVVVTIVNNLADLEALVRRGPDLVFLGMKFIPADQSAGRNDPNKIWIADYLDEHDILYTGSGHLAHRFELNKELAKQRVMDAGLNTSAFSLVMRGAVPDIAGTDLRYPVFVKPANRGGGEGVDSKSLAHNPQQLQDKVASISNDLQADSLIENYLPGREFSIAVLKNDYDDEHTVVPIELVASSDDAVLSAEIKSSNTSVVSLIADDELRNELSSLALAAFEALGARDYGRIDIRMDSLGVPHFLEANLLPSLIHDYGSFPIACGLGMDMAHEQMLLAIVSLAFSRLFADAEETAELGLYMPSSIPLPG